MFVVRFHNRGGVRSSKAQPSFGRFDCLIAIGVAARNSLAVARYRRRTTYRQSRRIDILVRATVAANVLGLARATSQRHGFLVQHRGELLADDNSLFYYCVGAGEVRQHQPLARCQMPFQHPSCQLSGVTVWSAKEWIGGKDLDTLYFSHSRGPSFHLSFHSLAVTRHGRDAP